MSREDYDLTLVCFGLAMGDFLRSRDLVEVKNLYGLLNRINEGNPHYKVAGVKE